MSEIVQTAGLLHFFCGKVAAGKSTMAKTIAQQENAILICEDIWLQRLYPIEIKSFDDYLLYSRRLQTVMFPHVQALLSLGHTVVFDYPANTRRTRQAIKEMYGAVGAHHCLHYLDTDRPRCLEQLARRNHELPEGSVVVSLEQFEAIEALIEPPCASEGFNLLRHT